MSRSNAPPKKPKPASGKPAGSIKDESATQAAETTSESVAPQAISKKDCKDYETATSLFIGSAWDELGLRSAVFHVVCHISRRVGKRSGKWGIRGIAKACRMNPETAIKAIREAEERKLIVCDRKFGRRTEYRLRPVQDWLTVENWLKAKQDRYLKPNSLNGNGECLVSAQQMISKENCYLEPNTPLPKTEQSEQKPLPNSERKASPSSKSPPDKASPLHAQSPQDHSPVARKVRRSQKNKKPFAVAGGEEAKKVTPDKKLLAVATPENSVEVLGPLHPKQDISALFSVAKRKCESKAKNKGPMLLKWFHVFLGYEDEHLPAPGLVEGQKLKAEEMTASADPQVQAIVDNILPFTSAEPAPDEKRETLIKLWEARDIRIGARSIAETMPIFEEKRFNKLCGEAFDKLLRAINE